MVPGAYVLVDALPLSPNGKLDRAALPAPPAAAERADAGRAPETLAEQSVARIFTEVLDAESVSADDDFFELGGHSLHATQVVSRIRRTFGVDVPLEALFEHPTVSSLAEEVERALIAELSSA
jgi:acyl carrier protein